MKLKDRVLLAIASGILVVSAAPAFGAAGISITVDDLANGTLNPLSFAHEHLLEPALGLTTLTYDLRPADVSGLSGLPGDVVINGPAGISLQSQVAGVADSFAYLAFSSLGSETLSAQQSVKPLSVVPEPASALLVTLGAAFLCLWNSGRQENRLADCRQTPSQAGRS